jgi:DNA topoisomerase-2
MSLRNLTKERRNEILREQQEKHEKLEALQKKSPEDLYEDDISHFEAEYHKVIVLLPFYLFFLTLLSFEKSAFPH